MSVLQRFEKRLEGLVEGAFAKVFKGVVHPVEILNAMQREAEAHKAILAGGRTLVPNRYVIDLSPYDHSRLAPYAAALAQELAQSQAEFIGEQGWTVYGDVIVEIERGEGLDTGMFRVTAEVYTGGEVAPVSAARLRRRPARLPARTTSGGGYGPPPGARRRPQRAAGLRRRAHLPAPMGSTVIGRGDQANLRLPDVGISRRHARLDFDGGQVVLTDLGLDQRHDGQRPAGLRGRAEPRRHDPARHDHADVPRGRLTALPEIVLTVARFGFLVLLWIFVFTVVGVIRRDLFAGVAVEPAGRRAPGGGRARRAGPAGEGEAGPGRAPAGGHRRCSWPAPGSPSARRQITIGRAEDSTLVITDDYASARHARLVPRDGQWFVEDLGSTNGTYLDRAKVTGPTPVPLGVPIRIGRTSLELRP